MNASDDGSHDLRHLRPLVKVYLGVERDLRVAVLDAVDAGHSLEELAEETGLDLPLLQLWAGTVVDGSGDVADSAGSGTGGATGGRAGGGGSGSRVRRSDVVDEVGEQRNLRSGTLSQRVAAADAKHAREDAREEAREEAREAARGEARRANRDEARRQSDPS